MSDAVVPHFAFPFSVDRDGAAHVLEQDTLDEVAQCVQVLLATPTGTRMEQPDYGVVDPVFQVEIDKGEVLRAVEEWEPRAAVALQDDPDKLDVLVRRVQARVAQGGE
jgi:phage baseplate assembly protein W